MAKKAPESKTKKAAKITSSSSKEKKKWTQGKARTVANRAVFVDSEMFAKIEKDVTKATVITAQALGERFGINIAVAKNILEHFLENNLIQCISSTSALKIFSKVQNTAGAVEGAEVIIAE